MLALFVFLEVTLFRDTSEKVRAWYENSFNSQEARNLPSYSSMRSILSEVLDKVKDQMTINVLCSRLLINLMASLLVATLKF